MPIEHIIYIPGVLLIGMVAGYVLGARAVRQDLERARKKSRR